MSNYGNQADNELIERLEAAHAILVPIHNHYSRANQLKTEAENGIADLSRQKKIYYAVAIILIFVAFPFGILGTVLTFFLYSKKKKSVEEHSTQCSVSAAGEVTAAEQLTIDNTETLSVLPDEYWYPMAAENIIKILRQGRASTLKEAMDHFDAMRREWLMDQRYAEMRAAMAQQNGNLEAIKHSSRINTALNVGRAVADVTRGVGRFFDNIG